MFDVFSFLGVLGFGVGFVGTLVGAGGGFILMPALVLLFPNEHHSYLTSLSLAVVFCNALSGTIAYSRLGLIDYRSGIIFAIASFPSAILGKIANHHIPRHALSVSLGTFMILGSGFLVYKTIRMKRIVLAQTGEVIATEDGIIPEPKNVQYNLKLGVGTSIVIGFLSSLLGIGGGFIQVPVLAFLLGFPMRVAVATAQFVLVFATLAASMVHGPGEIIKHGLHNFIGLACGVIIGAQVGVYFSTRIKGQSIILTLAATLATVGLFMVFKSLLM